MSNSEMAEADSSTILEINDEKQFKVVMIGDGGTGKTSYVARLNAGDYKNEYVATIGVEKHNILVNTNYGNFNINLWDTAGQEKTGPLRDSYYEQADAAIIFCDVTSRITYKNVPSWHKDVVRVCGDIPIVICANKIDIKERKVKSKSMVYHEKHKLGCFEISVLTRTSLKEPLQYLLQQLLHEPELKILNSLDASLFSDLSSIDITTN